MVESFSLEKTSKIPKLNLSPSLPLNHVHQCHISVVHSPSLLHLRGPQSLSATSPLSTVPQCHISMVHSPSVPHLQGRRPHHPLGDLCQCPTPHLEKSSSWHKFHVAGSPVLSILAPTPPAQEGTDLCLFSCSSLAKTLSKM